MPANGGNATTSKRTPPFSLLVFASLTQPTHHLFLPMAGPPMPPTTVQKPPLPSQVPPTSFKFLPSPPKSSLSTPPPPLAYFHRYSLPALLLCFLLNMAFSQESGSASAFALLAVSLVVVLFCNAVHAEEITVGDDAGWKLNFDYKKWAEGRQFNVNDVLVFNYPKNVHNVLALDDQTAFDNCVKSPFKKKFESGTDKITLSAPGTHWYICGVGTHCSGGGMKVAVNVGNSSSSGQPSAPNSASGLSAWTALVLGFVAVSLFAM